MRREGKAKPTMTIRRVLSLAIVLTALVGAGIAAAQQSDAAKAAAEPIMKQLEAFRRDDYEAAYVFASADVKQLFDRRAFERMVKDGYPEIARSTSAAVARAEMAPDGYVYVHLRIKGANGTGIEALYQMVREGDGWKVNSVMTRPDTGTL